MCVSACLCVSVYVSLSLSLCVCFALSYECDIVHARSASRRTVMYINSFVVHMPVSHLAVVLRGFEGRVSAPCVTTTICLRDMSRAVIFLFLEPPTHPHHPSTYLHPTTHPSTHSDSQSGIVLLEAHVAEGHGGREHDHHAKDGHPKHNLVRRDVAQAVHGARAGAAA